MRQNGRIITPRDDGREQFNDLDETGVTVRISEPPTIGKNFSFQQRHLTI